ASLAVYNLQRIDEDLLKQLYQNLVEPETRHELGEFYTPDWLAEMTLREIGYGPGKSLLDPACGSGTFLFTALRLLAEAGLRDDALVDFALEHVMGVDVHPLAVTIARINYMLAILPHLQASTERRQRAIPVAMANSLQVPSKAGPVSVIAVNFDGQRDFRIPTEAARRPRELGQVLAEMQRRAEQVAPAYPNIKSEKFGEYALGQLPVGPAGTEWTNKEFVKATWDQNLRDLAEQISRKRDSIWVYVLQNTSQPLILQHRKFDVIAGNPPWIAYRYLQDESYRNDVKTLTREYGLLEPGDVKLNTQMELSTLFYEHCYRAYLKPGGTIAMVMPRSVLTGAKQHRAFQRKGFSRLLDLKGVAPLFNVETCVAIRAGGNVLTVGIPTKQYTGTLPGHECGYDVARNALTEAGGEMSFAEQAEVASPFYHPRFKQGATLIPRNLVFVTSAQPDLKPGQVARSSIMRTDPDVDAEAKAPWKGLALEGHIDDEFLYATLLSKNLVPFGVRRLHLVALPVTVGVPPQLAALPGRDREERFLPMSLEEMRESIKYGRSADEWFARAEHVWQSHKKETTKETLAEWLNYQNKITAQSAEPGYLLVFNAAGSNIASAVVDTRELPVINGTRPHAFVLDHTAYWFRSENPNEPHYLSALLNAPCVDAAIKSHQTRGLYGPRHIHRRPFEVCPIPEFDASNADHLRLAELSEAAHAAVAALDLREGGVVAARKKAREAARGHIREIDAIARRLLGLPAAET
ncbi:MAG TPA: N-6 DNA methylase, partial [Ktedonobacterales bacterium]|nr:N-6 DNA methylase [Ktedonobacterales bacterium]